MQKWIETETKRLRSFFRLTDDRWNHLVRRLDDQLEARRPDFYDEVVWTFLLGVSYAASGWDGIRKLEALLSGTTVDPPVQHPIWLEALPMPPRSKEGNTNVDLAIGAITDRPSVKVDTTERPAKEGGIAYDPTLGSSVTFCEMKWYSDISKSVTHDQHRNQLSRVIENAVTFQINKQWVDRVTVTLVTPRIFVGTEPKSRLYHYKLEEYRNPEFLLREWRRSYQRMPKRSHSDWKYPEDDHLLDILTNRFTLQHLSFEELFEKAPESAFTPHLQEFLSAANGSQRHFGCDPSE
jgi:hypothetical protein